MTRVTLAVLAALLATTGLAPTAQTSPIKALVGGTLIDGFGGPPIRNSVDPHRGRADHGGGPGRHAGGAAGRRGHLHRRHERAPRPLGHARPPDDQRARRLRALGQDLPGAVRVGDHAGLREPAADGRRHQRARPRRAARGQHQRPRPHQRRQDSRADPVRLRAVHPEGAVSRDRAVSLGRQRGRRRARQGRQSSRTRASTASS